MQQNTIGARTSSSEGSCAVARVDMMMPIRLQMQHQNIATGSSYSCSSPTSVCSVIYDAAYGIMCVRGCMLLHNIILPCRALHAGCSAAAYSAVVWRQSLTKWYLEP